MNQANSLPPFIPEKYRGRARLTRKDCADIAGRSVAFFDRLAWKGEGPPFIKASQRGPVSYPVPEFFEWLEGLGQADMNAGAK
jgi:hypothetical protein